LLKRSFTRVIIAQLKVGIAIDLLEDRALIFIFFLRNLIRGDDRNYWLQIREISQFQAKVSISMVLQEVFETISVIDLDRTLILLIYDVF
jgi:hypothetical protein